MKFQTLAKFFLGSCLAFAMNANAAVITGPNTLVGTVEAFDIETLSFSVTSSGVTTFDVLARGFTSGPSSQGLRDSMIRIARDDGSLDSSDFLFMNDDSSTSLGSDGSTSLFDSFLSVNLNAGDYLFFIGAFNLEVSEILNDSFSSPGASSAGDYQLTFSDNANFGSTASVSEPASLALFGLGLCGLGLVRKRRAA